MQVFPWSAAGTLANSSALKLDWVHQQGGCFWPVLRSISMAHWLSLPHSGHTSGVVERGMDMVSTV